MDIKFVILEDMIPYDFEDCDKWGAVLFDIENKQIITSKYGHGVDMNERKNSVELDYAIEHNLVSIEEMIDIMINIYNNLAFFCVIINPFIIFTYFPNNRKLTF